MLVTLTVVTQQGSEAKKSGKVTTETMRMMIPLSMLFEEGINIIERKVDFLIGQNAIPVVKFFDSRSRLLKILKIEHQGRASLSLEVEQFFKDNPSSMVILLGDVESASIMSMTNV